MADHEDQLRTKLLATEVELSIANGAVEGARKVARHYGETIEAYRRANVEQAEQIENQEELLAKYRDDNEELAKERDELRNRANLEDSGQVRRALVETSAETTIAKADAGLLMTQTGTLLMKTEPHEVAPGVMDWLVHVAETGELYAPEGDIETTPVKHISQF